MSNGKDMTQMAVADPNHILYTDILRYVNAIESILDDMRHEVYTCCNYCNVGHGAGDSGTSTIVVDENEVGPLEQGGFGHLTKSELEQIEDRAYLYTNTECEDMVTDRLIEIDILLLLAEIRELRSQVGMD